MLQKAVLHALVETDWRAGRGKGGLSMETSYKADAIGDDGWWFGADSENIGGEKCSDSRHILKVKPRGFPAEGKVVQKKKKGVKGDCEVFSLSNGMLA